VCLFPVSNDESDNYINVIMSYTVSAQDVQKWLAGFRRTTSYFVTQRAHRDRNGFLCCNYIGHCPLSEVVCGFHGCFAAGGP
jgi:hypothetical protein